ncbi:MAG: hypothetical protein LC687_07200, partial [Actinobacteria bacterium]|nr:hypothetical protein [Actinomycetota bacterium]
MAKELSDKKLAAILEQAVSNSEHMIDGKLSGERREVERYYRGELPKPQHSGDSKYVSRDVFETVDSMRSTILETFSANTRIVFWQPEKGETTEDAKQATDYCRHVFFKQNEGEDVMYDVLTDSLMKRYSVVKVRYEETEEEDSYDFDGLTGEELAMFVEDFDEYEFTEAETSENGLYSGTVTVPRVEKKIVVEAIQPEDFMVSSRTADLKDAKYCIHRTSKSRSDLLKEGFDKSKVDKMNFSGSYDLEMDYEK